MGIRTGAESEAPRHSSLSLAALQVIPCVCLFVAGCGAPGEPVPPVAPIPAAVSDLSARQVGNSVLLTFTAPNKTTLGERLGEMPTLEVLRGSLAEDGTLEPKSFRVVDTVPGTVLSSYVQQGKVQFPEPISAEEMRANPVESVAYRIRTRVSERKASADSNAVTVNLHPVPEAIGAVDAQVTENGIQLKWTAPSSNSIGEQLSSVKEYHVYRGELEAEPARGTTQDLRQAKWKLPLLPLATTAVPEYEDRGFDYGKTYAYMVRSAVPVDGGLLESADSKTAIVTPNDTFPPAAPQSVVAAVLPGASAGSYVVDLSWGINVETDLAGYRVYRSESEGTRGTLVAPDLLLTPAFRDTSVQGGHSYWYTVTAVDRAGNESGPSQAVAVEIAQPSR
jgi:hypothetical protein